MTSADTLIDDLEALTGQLDVALEATEGGALVDLAGLDLQVSRICGEVDRLAAVGDRPEPVARGLEDVLKRMDRLEETMKTAQANLAGSVGGIGYHKRAVTAYGKAPSSSPSKPPRR